MDKMEQMKNSLGDGFTGAKDILNGGINDIKLSQTVSRDIRLLSNTANF